MKKHFNRFLSLVFTTADDRMSDLFFHTARVKAINMLRLQTMERLLIIEVGTGLDIPLLPPGLWVTGIDSSPQKLQRARGRTSGHYVTLERMDPQSLIYGDSSFNAAILYLALGNESDCVKAFQEAWRVVCPGGRLVILGCFMKDRGWISHICRWFGGIATDGHIISGQRLLDVIGCSHDLVIERNEPAACHGNCRVILTRKENLK